MVTIGDILTVAIAFLALVVAVGGPVAGCAYLLSIFRGITLGD
jgi:hypothetical protein